MCKKKISMWSSYTKDDEYYCDECWKNKQELINKSYNKVKEECDNFKKELTFILEKGEKIIKEASSLQYAGPTLLSYGSGTGISSGFGGNLGLGTGFFSSKQIKREGSLLDAKTVHLYLTNKRIIFCNAKVSIFSKEEKSISSIFSEINYKNIKGLNTSSKFGNPAIDISVVGQNGIDNIKFWFLGSEDKRGEERNKFLGLIKKQIK